MLFTTNSFCMKDSLLLVFFAKTIVSLSYDDKNREITLVNQAQKQDVTGYVLEPTYTNIEYIVALTILKRQLQK